MVEDDRMKVEVEEQKRKEEETSTVVGQPAVRRSGSVTKKVEAAVLAGHMRQVHNGTTKNSTDGGKENRTEKAYDQRGRRRLLKRRCRRRVEDKACRESFLGTE